MSDFPWLGLDERFEFPDPRRAPGGAPLAQGGNLSPGMLLSAYAQGIFPWYSEGEPILWWSPDPRFVVFPDRVHVSSSMRKVLRQKRFSVSFDTRFEDVIRGCSQAPRPGQDGTWIVEDMVQAYCRLHRAGYAHSVEVWRDGELAGGLYGVGVGGVFCGESMFSRADNASKAGFLTLSRHLATAGVAVIDSQVHTDYLASLGAEHVPRARYLELLADNADRPLLDGSWTGRFGDVEW